MIFFSEGRVSQYFPFPFSQILAMHTQFKCVVLATMVTSLLLTHISCSPSYDVGVLFPSPLGAAATGLQVFTH